MKKINELPVLSGEAQRPKTQVPLSSLKGNSNLGGYSARVGDVIEFPDTIEDVQAFVQAVRPGSSIVRHVIVVKRNGHLDYFSPSYLARRDIHGQVVDSAFAKKMAAFDSDEARIKALIGHTIKCVGIANITTFVFDNGVRTDETHEVHTPIFEDLSHKNDEEKESCSETLGLTNERPVLSGEIQDPKTQVSLSSFKGNGYSSEHSNNMSNYDLKILVDIPCEVFIDSEFKGVVRKDALTKFSLNKGEYQLLLRSTVNQNYSIEEFIFIEYDRILKYSFRERFASRQELVQDSDIRMIDTDCGHRFRDIALGIDLPGEFSTRYGMDDSDEQWTEELNRFHEGFAAVQSLFGRELFFIDPKGNVIAKGYRAISEFHEGLAGVSDGSKYGFVDKTGQIIIGLQFEKAGMFNEGLASVSQNGKWGYINQKGDIVIPCNYDSCGAFKNGYAIVTINSKVGLINTSGRFVIPAEYDKVQQSANPNAYIIVKDKKCGAASVSGSILFPCEYDYIRIFKSNSRVACAGKGKEHFLLNDDRTTTLESDYDTKYYSFFSNRVLQREEKGYDWYSSKMCLCNLQGKPITRHYDYDDDHVVNKGWSWDTWYRGGGLFGFVNDNGEEYITCKYQYAHNFSEDLAAVNKGGSFPPGNGPHFTGGKWGYINRKGEEVVPFQYDNACSFYGGAALVRIGKRSFYIDRYGNEL